jgi:uncharacterized protein YbjT (DUF2867 family)
MILVVGATGQLGSKITRGLIARSMRVRALARPGSAHQPLEQLGAEVVPGDLRNPGSLDAACAGVDTVITTANSARRGGEDTVSSVDLKGTQSLIDAATAAGVRRFIYTSVLGASADSPVPFLAAKGSSEAHLRASGMEWTVLAPDAFMESWPARVVGAPALAGAPVVIVGEGRRRHMFVAEDDVAAFAVVAADSREATNQRIPIGGPDALTWYDVVAVYERVLGRPLQVTSVAPGEPVPGVPPAVLPLLASFETYDSVFDARESASRFGIALTPLETVARRQTAVPPAR